MHIARKMGIALIFSLQGLQGQQVAANVIFSTLPPLTPQSLQVTGGSAHAFFDTGVNQIAVVIPSTIADTSPSVLHFDLPTLVRPSVTWSVTALGPEEFSYKYFISDDPASPQRSARLSVLVPDHDATLRRLDSAAWSYSVENTKTPDRSSTVPMAMMKRVFWQDHVPSAAKLAGFSVGLASAYRPGFCDVLVEGQVASPLTTEALASLPPEVLADVQKALEAGIGSVRRQGMCPLFRPDTPQTVIVSNYHLGLQHMIRNGVLDGSSSYVRSLMAYLQAFLESGAVGNAALPTLAPGSDFERLIHQALSISLSGK